MSTELTFIEKTLQKCKQTLGILFLFSFAINFFSLAVPLYSLQIFDRVLSSGSFETLTMLTIIVLITVIILGLLQNIRAYILMKMGSWIDTSVSGDCLSVSVNKLAHQESMSGSQPLRDLATIKGFVSGQVLQQLFDAPWAIIFFIVIFLIHPIMGTICLLAGFVLLGLAILNEKQTKGPLQKANELSAKNMQLAESITQNSEVIKSMGMLSKIMMSWQNSNQKTSQEQLKAYQKSNMYGSIARSIRLVIQMITTGASAYLVLTHKMSPGGIVAISILSGKALAPFDASINTWKSTLTVQKAFSRLKELMNHMPKEEEYFDYQEIEGDISLDKLYYMAPGTKKPIIKGIQATIQSGDIVGLVGPSGSGKSTLIKLMVGILEPSSGVVRFDNVDIKQWDKSKLGNFLGYLPQEVELFQGSVKDNIARMDTSVDDKDVIDSAQIAGAHDVILSLSNGYKTQVGNQGTNLSAGQRQRVGLARAFFHQAKIIVLDEPNAHLDQEGEAALLKSLDYAKQKGVTVIIVSHRPTILSKVDKLMILLDGQIQKYGPTKEVAPTIMKAS